MNEVTRILSAIEQGDPHAERNWTYARTWLHRELAQLDKADV